MVDAEGEAGDIAHVAISLGHGIGTIGQIITPVIIVADLGVEGINLSVLGEALCYAHGVLGSAGLVTCG